MHNKALPKCRQGFCNSFFIVAIICPLAAGTAPRTGGFAGFFVFYNYYQCRKHRGDDNYYRYNRINIPIFLHIKFLYLRKFKWSINSLTFCALLPSSFFSKAIFLIFLRFSLLKITSKILRTHISGNNHLCFLSIG